MFQGLVACTSGNQPPRTMGTCRVRIFLWNLLLMTTATWAVGTAETTPEDSAMLGKCRLNWLGSLWPGLPRILTGIIITIIPLILSALVVFVYRLQLNQVMIKRTQLPIQHMTTKLNRALMNQAVLIEAIQLQHDSISMLISALQTKVDMLSHKCPANVANTATADKSTQHPCDNQW